MLSSRRLWTGVAVLACLGFTGAHVAWADPAQQLGIDYIEDPYAPHVTTGSTARLGTAVGFIYGERQDVMALGMAAAGGHRFGRLTLEAELGLFQLQTADNTETKLGSQQRLGVIGRFDVLRAGSRIVGPNSMFAAYVEGGAAQTWTQWLRPGNADPERMVPDDAKRVEGLVGFGIMIDHRLQEPITVPRRVGWFLGWRMAYAPHDAEAASICRGVVCRAAPTMPEARYTDRAMLFQSSMSVTW